MHELFVVLGTLLGCIISYFTINKFVFYTKAEVNDKLNQIKDESDKRDEIISLKLERNHAEVKEEITETKDMIFEKLLEAERVSNKARQDLYDRLTQNKEIFEDYNKNILAAMVEIKQDEKESDAKFIQLLNDVKDELKNDYTNRYNEIITLMGNKVNVADFDRLENKFDKVTETIIQLKTIVERKLDKKWDK